MANTNNEYVLIAGSISKNTEKLYIDRAHNFVRALTKSILDANVGLVVYLAGEPVNENGDPLTFDWTIVNEVADLMESYTPVQQLKIVTSRSAMREKMSEKERMLIRKLLVSKFADVSYLDDDLITGGNIGSEQVDAATAMIALGGGKGVSDRASKMRKANHPILPFDLELGGICDDGKGSLGLHARFYAEPLSMFPCIGEAVKNQLDTLSLQEPYYDLERLSEIAVELLKAEWAEQQLLHTPNVLILTALPVELAAAKKVFDIADDVPPRLTSNGIHFWSVVIQRSDGPVTGIVASFASAGNVNASAITSMLLLEFKPQKVMMMGIAAGLREKMVLGEVIISDRVIYYESAAALEGGKLAPRPEILRPHMSTQQNLNTYLSTVSLSARLGERAQTIGLEMPVNSQAGGVATGIIVSPATIASGELLIRDPALQESFRSLHDKAYVAEMEAYGVFDACEKQRVPALIVRGISDFGDSTKDDVFHSIASVAAAIITADYLVHGWIRA